MTKAKLVVKLIMVLVAGCLIYQQHQINSIQGELHRLEIYVTAE